MSYAKSVQQARDALNKDGNATPAMLDYQAEVTQMYSALRDQRQQYAYSLFLQKPAMTTKDFYKLSNYPDKTGMMVLRELEGMGLLTHTRLINNDHSVLWGIVDDKKIPEGWAPKGVLLNMENPYKDYVPKRREKAPKISIEDVSDNPFTRMLQNVNQHPTEVSGYEQFMKDTAKFYGPEELDDVVKALHEICKRRIEQKYIECPLCKGRIQRDGAKATCVSCGAELNAGSFEQSMKALAILAKAGVKIA